MADLSKHSDKELKSAARASKWIGFVAALITLIGVPAFVLVGIWGSSWQWIATAVVVGFASMAVWLMFGYAKSELEDELKMRDRRNSYRSGRVTVDLDGLDTSKLVKDFREHGDQESN